MFERYITDVLTTYFGQYIQNVDTDKIRLSAWNGRLILEDVQLRSDCLERLFHSASSNADLPSCPVEMIHGHIGLLELQIPWKLLRKQLLVSSSTSRKESNNSDTSNIISLRLSQVDILIAPIRRPAQSGSSTDPSDPPSDNSLENDNVDDVTRQQRIQAAMDAALLRRVALSSSSKSSSSDDSSKYASSWKKRLQDRLQSVFSNISVTIQNIHVRYEDPGNCLGFVAYSSPQQQYRPPLAIGITLQEFCIPTTASPRRALTQDLAAYWDSDAALFIAQKEPAAVAAFQEWNRGGYHFYVLDPFSPSLHLCLASVEEDRTTNTLDIFCPPCRWNISKHLLEDLGYLRKSIAIWKRRDVLLPSSEQLEWRRWRPSSGFHPREWWHYAYQSIAMILRRNHSRRHPSNDWLTLARALGRRRRYVHLYKDFLLCPNAPGRQRFHEELLALERTLCTEEIVAFRMYLYQSISPTDRETESVDDDSRDANTPDRVLTMDHRSQMFREMIMALDREQENRLVQQQLLERSVVNGDNVSSSPVLSWILTLQCVELSLQVHDSQEIVGRKRRMRKDDSVPVIFLSCAFDQQHQLFDCGSWNSTFRAGSLFVKDCTMLSDRSPFANLIGLQQGAAAVQPVDSFTIDGSVHQQVVWIQVKRHIQIAQDDVVASRTETKVRVLPLEVVYSTAPIEALNHILTVANVDFSNDYQRILNRFAVWKQRQQRRLLSALAHKQKHIFVDVVIGSPAFLFPEGLHLSSTMLVIDLGMLRFSNAASRSPLEYDDKWLLEMTDVQVKSMLVHQYCSTPDSIEREKTSWPHYIIEPFSLKFDISTRVQTSESGTSDTPSSIFVLANLPRLAVNLKSSVVCLLFRLQRQWMKLKKGRRLVVPVKTIERRVMSTSEPENPRQLEFRFIAPIFSVKFESNCRQRAVEAESTFESVPLFDLALKGIEGSVLRFTSAECTSTKFSAKVGALVAMDLYQSAGADYKMLLSSVPPSFVDAASNTNILSDQFVTDTNLVSFEYTSKMDFLSDFDLDEKPFEDGIDSNLLSIKFHELFVEWNPETIAMISYSVSYSDVVFDVDKAEAMDTSNSQETAHVFENDSTKEEEFFDAEEDAFFDAESVASCDQDCGLLSEISESERSSVSDFIPSPLLGPLSSFTGIGVPLAVMQPVAPGSPWSGRAFQPIPQASISDSRPIKSFLLVFELSKLRVNFNKESRRRRLITAEMDMTEVRYNTMGGHGSKIHFMIGNLTFSDCESVHNNTLYREILGLQTEGLNKNGEHSSLLEMKMITKPRMRKYGSLDEIESIPTTDAGTPVLVDTCKGSIRGFDNHLEARLSPMRFVYLQQLWFEIVDYFFSAIVGYEVWGSKTPIPGDTTMLTGKSIGADEVPFTIFDFSLHSPIILFPVSSCSTHFVRLTASSVSLTNRYSFEPMRPDSLYFRGDGVSRQWYNNCLVFIEGMALTSWSGSVLDRVDERPSARLSMSWPVGPSAPVNVPKWKFNCNVDSMHFVLDREDFALLQHIVQHNVGGASLHLDEWDLLQRLTPTVRSRFLDSLLVQFPYDKKDTTPSTFDITVMTSKVLFVFKKVENDIAVVRCSDVSWKYEKLLDRVTKQSVTCSFDVLESLHGSPVLSSITEERATMDEIVFPTLSYSSITYPSLNNDKSLVITDACIDTIYSFWVGFRAFFQNLPLPVYLSPNEAIQVGDRWYKIVEHSPSNAREESLRRLNWIPKLGPSFQDGSDHPGILSPTLTFHFSLIRPAIRICSGVSAVVLAIDRFIYSHKSCNGQLSSTLIVQNVELLTRTLGKMRRSSEFSLIQPWSFNITMSGCRNDDTCTCLSHSVHASVGLLQARAAYSDITVALDACMLLNKDIKSFCVPTHQENGNKSFESKYHSHDQRPVGRHVQKWRLTAAWEGFRFVVTDDTGRHFIGNQDLVLIQCQGLSFNRADTDETEMLDSASVRLLPRAAVTSIHLQVKEFDVIDCLQSFQSPFRNVLRVTSRSVSATNSNISKEDSAQFDSDCKQDSFAVEIRIDGKEDKEYGIEFGIVEIQYNPSFIVALQRFLGRLLKETKMRHGYLFEDSSRHVPKVDNVIATNVMSTMRHAFASRSIILIRHMLVSLNKEHQKRRLLNMSITSILVDFEWRPAFSSVRGHIASFSAFDPAGNEPYISKVVVRSTSTDHHFIEFDYKFFSCRRSEFSSTSGTMPLWICARLKDDDTIDDYLDVSVSTLDFVYLKPRTAELLDYLSSGMPGKGMGATSRAAKGFVKERIQKRSFANVKLGAPRILIPQSLFVETCVILRLGDMSLKTWMSVNKDSVDIRKVEVLLLGCCIDMCRSVEAGAAETILMSKVDIQVDAELSSVATTVRCHLSDVLTRLSYKEYVALRCISRDNIGRKTDRDHWDNLEKSWEKESKVTDAFGEDSLVYSVDVTYSASARVIRFGQEKRSRAMPSRMKLVVSCGSFALVLGDDFSAVDSVGVYDMIGIRVQSFDFEVGRKEDGEEWLNLSLGNIFVVDLGKVKRCAQMKYHPIENPEIFDSLSVLVEGYISEPIRNAIDATIDSHLVVKIDRDSGSSEDVNIVIIISFLSVTLFREPIHDLWSFVMCKWTSGVPSTASGREDLLLALDSASNTERTTEKSGLWSFPTNSDIKIRFVSHYARFVLAADELDPHSRSLMLTGLSIVNASFRPVQAASEPATGAALSFNADFQDFSSYMIPDIAKIVGIKHQHVASMNELLPSLDLELMKSVCDGEKRDEELGVPLLLPLTFGVEYEQESAPNMPTSRSIAISIDPLSVFLSHDDVRLLIAVVYSWTSRKKSSEKLKNNARFLYDVSFNSEKLGLGLRKEKGFVVVDNVADSKNQRMIQTGDVLFSINGMEIVDLTTLTLGDVVNRLSSERRPLTLTFAREMPFTKKDNVTDVPFDSRKAILGYVDNVSFSMSSSAITFVEKDLPLLRGSLSTAKFSCHVVRSSATTVKIDLSFGISVDYYNLRLWGWEPFVDPGVVFLSSSYQDSRHSPRELSIEVGDRDVGLSVNVTDALMRSLSKIMDWRSMKLEDDMDEVEGFFFDDRFHSIDIESSKDVPRDVISQKAAIAAFKFASRQKLGTAKPFIFRNRSGVAVAFAIQKGYLKVHRSTESALSVEDFSGLEQLESPDIMVLSNGEDLRFRIDVSSSDVDKRLTLFPAFTVAIQKTSGIAVQPFENLQTSRLGELLLSFVYNGGENPGIPQRRPWMSWLVEQSDESTVVTIGSSIRLISLLSQAIEVGIAAEKHYGTSINDASIMSLGTLRAESPLPLPLWIAMQHQCWVCYLKLGSGFHFVPIFIVSPDGCVTKTPNVLDGFIECQPILGSLMSSWLSVNVYDEGGVLAVHVDGSVSIRNLLPLNVDWELGHVDSDPADGSTVRSMPLQSGEEVDVLTNNFSMALIRLRPTYGDFSWSSWESLTLSQKREAVPKYEDWTIDDSFSGQEESYVTVYVKDMFSFPLPIGLRIATKAIGVDVTLYADVWCVNYTSIDIVFGSQSINVVQEDNQPITSKPFKDLSVAEATLKEISLLFESDVKNSEKYSYESFDDVVRIPGQVSSHIVEECFEYVEVEGNNVVQRWWASENPFSPRDLVFFNEQEKCKWIDKTWVLDDFGKTFEGWESSLDLDAFPSNRTFNACHRYRRRRWIRAHSGMPKIALLDGASAFFHFPKISKLSPLDKKTEHSGIQLAIQVNGGRWSLISAIPRQGSVHGVVRVYSARWPHVAGELPSSESGVFELCYVVSALDGDWGLLTRSLVLSSRFLLRNDSTTITFEVKQTGATDTSAVIIRPGQTEPFHWGNCRLPELMSVRPSFRYEDRCIYKWSGGFDPLVIGHMALRIRRVLSHADRNNQDTVVRAVKAEVEIRPQTGGTGINLSFREEDESGGGALYRIENLSPFPIWFCQDDVLSNPSRNASDEDHSDIAFPSRSIVFALDIPFKQGKYSHRKALSFSSLLRVRLALSPFSTRAGIETTKVISLAAGDTVRLNPSKLMILAPELRNELQDVRVIGTLVNDGPTRVLKLRLMAFSSSDIQAWPHPVILSWHDDLSPTFQEVVDGAVKAAEMRRLKLLPLEENALQLLLSPQDGESSVVESKSTLFPTEMPRNLIVSFRASFGGLMVSLVDSAPSEIALATFKNLNAIATWDSLRLTNSTIYITIACVQVDNMVPNSPFPVAIAPIDQSRVNRLGESTSEDDVPPLLVIGLSFAPKHKSGILCLKSATIAPRNLAIKVDLAFLVRLQKFALDLREHFHKTEKDWGGRLKPPLLHGQASAAFAITDSGTRKQKIFFGGLTILPCNIKLSVAPARALTPAQAVLEGEETAAIHQAVRKGDVRLDRKSAGILGVKIGSKNKTPLAVVRGLFKSFLVDGLLRLDGASLNFAGVSLRNHTSTSSQLTTALTAHYLASLRQNLPAVLGSLAAFGNPLGLVRGLGEGVGDFVLEPVRGFQRSVQEMDASYLVDGVARGTLSLARHTVGGFADSAAMLAETFSKNMAVLTLDRKYAQKRDRDYELRDNDDLNVATGLGSGVQKLVNGFLEGVTGVVRAPIRGAEKHGFEGFAKGIGKGLLGLLVKPIIGISDGITDVMIGVKGSVEGSSAVSQQIRQVRPRRALYGPEKAIRSFVFADAAASALMLRTSLAGDAYLSHLDLGDRVILLSCKRMIVLGRQGEELFLLRLKHIDRVEIRGVQQEDSNVEWGVVIFLNTPRQNGNEVEVIVCNDKQQAEQLLVQLEHGRKVASTL